MKNLEIKCEEINVQYRTLYNCIEVTLYNLNENQLYMDNDLSEILDQIPLDELEEYIKERKKEDGC